jgi:integrase
MAQDAITDEVCVSIEEMPRFARAAGRYEALVRTFTDTGMRLGEVLPSAAKLRRRDLQVRRTAHEGTILEGTKTDHGEEDAGRVVPVPATLAWMLEAQINLNGPDCKLLFPTPRGRLWRERTFYRDVWKPTQ